MNVTTRQFQPVQYTERVLDLQHQIKQVEQALTDLPQESLRLTQQIASQQRLEKQSHLLALGSAGVALTGLLAPLGSAGWGLVAVGVAGALASEWKAADHHVVAKDSTTQKDLLSLKRFHLQDNLEFLSEWECQRRHSEWHDVNGYP